MPNTDSRPAEPGRRIRAGGRGGRTIHKDEQLTQAGRDIRRAARESKARSGMELTDIAQLNTQSHTPAGSLQARSQGLSVEDAAAGVARPKRPEWADGGKRLPCGRHHTGYQGSPSSGSSSARLGRPSDVRAGRNLGVVGVARGGKTTPIQGCTCIGLGERGLDEGPASNRLVALAVLAVLAALRAPPGGRNTGQPRHRGSCGDTAAHRGTSERRRRVGPSRGNRRSRGLSRNSGGARGSGSRNRGLSGGLSGVRISPGGLGLNISRRASSINDAAQDGCSRGSRDSRLIDGITEPGTRHRGRSAYPGIDPGCGNRHVIISADRSLGLSRSGSEGSCKGDPPLR